MYTPLGIKTDYSLLKSLIKIEDLILFAKNNKLNTIGILDNNLNSSHMFYKKCLENNIKPIIGLDIEIDNYKLYLYPKNMDGLINLFKLTKNKINNIISINDLSNYSDNVICVVPLQSKDIYGNMKNIFYKTFISYNSKEEEKNARVITDDAIYIKEIVAPTKESSKFVNYLHMMEDGSTLGEKELINYENNILEITDEDTSLLTDLIDIKFDTSKRYIPMYDANMDSYEYLSNIANKGLAKRLNNNITDEYKERLEYELSVIKKMGFVDYFLIVFDYVRYALKNNIFVGAGRGSAAGSLVAYSLGITWIDPLKYNLLFERFLNPDRVTMPDIDIDFEDERREEVVSYVKNKYGIDKVAKIIAYGTLTAKDVIRSVAKINNVEDIYLNNLMKLLDSKKSLKENLTLEVKTLLSRNSKLDKVYKESIYLEGLKKHITTHAAGVVICSKDLTDILPIVKSGDEILTGYDKDELEELGILKMDFLSIKNLSIMSSILKDIEKNEGKKININNIPLDDKNVYDLFCRADTVGVFQFESAGMKNFLRRLKPETFDDLVMALAIFRPGPMASIDNYLDRKNHHKKYSYIVPELSNILKDTYGILIYQEQIMEILRVMGNFTYAEADIIRRAISKKKLNVIEEAKEKFINNSLKNNHTKEEAMEVYNLILKFADFGFNKSHSVAYAFIAYQMAYLKVHFKEYYYINLLNNNIGGETKTKEYINEAKKNGIKILKPDVNYSEKIYIKEQDAIRLPLRVIKGVGIQGSDSIINERGNKTYQDFFDFISRVYGKNVNKKTLECLIDAGVFDNFGFNRATLNKNINSAINYAELMKEFDSSLVSKPIMDCVSEDSELNLMNKELELFGYYVSTHPASKYPNVMKQIDIESFFDKYVTTVVLIDKIKIIQTKNNEDMAFITGSDETTSSEFIAFPNSINLKSIKIGDLVKIQGKVEKRLDKYQIIINKLEII